MKTCCKRALMMGSVVMFLALGGKASAATSDLIQALNGPAACAALTINKIKELNDVPPADFLKDADGQEISYTITSGKQGDTLEFASKIPINVVVLGLKDRGATAFYYGEGVTDDTGLQAGGTTIKLVRFCYGLSLETQPLAECSQELCDEIAPQDENAVAIILYPDSDQWGGVPRCTCGPAGTGFSRCNPAAKATNEPGAACTELDRGLSFIPIEVIAGQDPWVCFTIGGKRKCYCKDSNLTKTGCQ